MNRRIRCIGCLLLMAAAAVAETVHAHGAMPVPLALVDRLLDSQLSGATAVAAGDPSTWPSIAEEMKALGSGDLQAMPAAYNRLVARGAAVAPASPKGCPIRAPACCSASGC